MNRLIRVKTFPDAKKYHLEEVEPFVLRIFMREPAKNNLANKKVLESVADFYSIPRNKLRMVTGHRGQQKTIEVLPE